VSTLLSNSCLP